MIYQELGKHCKLKQGLAFKSSDFVTEGVPIIRISNIKKGQVSIESSVKITKDPKFNKYLIPPNSILIAMSGATTGKFGLFKQTSSAYLNQRVGCFSPSANLDTSYLFHALKYCGDIIREKAYGGAQPNISSKGIESIKIPIPYKENKPDLEAQVKIAKLLNRVERMVRTRKDNIDYLDSLVKSIFIQLFGDPSKNEKNWEPTSIGDLVDDVKYGTSAFSDGDKFKYLRMNNIDTNGYWDFSNLKRIDVNEKDYEKYVVRKGDLIFNRTNSKELVGKTAVFDQDEEMIIAGYLIRIRTNAENNPWYIWGYLNSYVGKEKLFNLCRSIVGMANINAQELQKIKVHKTPLDLQNKFEKAVKRVLALKEKYQQNLTELENLYGALSQKAFKGGLDLSRVHSAEEVEPEDFIEPVVFTSKQVTAERPEASVCAPAGIVEVNKIKYTTLDNFLLNHKGSVFTASFLWNEIKELEGAPESFLGFKKWVINCFKEKHLNQVYHEFEEKDKAGKDQLNSRIAIEVVQDAP